MQFECWAKTPTGRTLGPLVVAAGCGHVEVVREFIRQVGIEGCGGKQGGSLDALCFASDKQQLDTMATLTDAGVVDTGVTLHGSIQYGREASVKFLLQRQGGRRPACKDAYLNNRDGSGRTPLFQSSDGCHPGTPRIVRMLVDAGADTASEVRVTNTAGVVEFAGTPLVFTNRSLRWKSVRGRAATEEQLNRLLAISRLLSRVDAVHAVSWLWPNAAPVVDRAAKDARQTKMNSSSLTRMLLILRRRNAATRRVLVADLFRWVWMLLHTWRVVRTR